MTDPTTPAPGSGTPLWQPSATTAAPEPAVPSGTSPAPEPVPYQPSVAQRAQRGAAAPHPYQSAPAPWEQLQPHGPAAPVQDGHQAAPQQYGFGQGADPYQPTQAPQWPAQYGPPAQQYPTQQGLVPGDQAPDWVHAVPTYRAAPAKPPAVPVEPKRHSQFLQTPRRRWWKLPIALIVAGVAWLIGSTIATIPAVVYDLINQKIDLTNAAAIADFLGSITTHVTPALFLANNVGIALMIPSAWLGLIIYGQKPRWLSSVVGGLRWKWLFRILGLILLPYIALEVLTLLVTGVPQLTWKPYSLFMILVVLLTTPLQCAGEEYGLRGLINRLAGSYGSSRRSFWTGAIVSSLAFMFLHAAQDIYLNVFYFSFGMLSCWMAWRTGGLEAGIALHVVNNITAMAVFPFSDFSGVFNRTAGSANPWDVVPLGAVMLASMGLVEWQARKQKPVAVAAPGAAYVEGQFAPAAVGSA